MTISQKEKKRAFIRALLLITVLALPSCTTLPKPDVKNLATKAALRSAQPLLEKIFLAEAPILPPQSSLYPTIYKLPGTPFNPIFKLDSISLNALGNLLLAPGDYTFPVMTYCMKESGTSPRGHSYVLSYLKGKRAKIIREVNAKALENYSPQEVQFLSWSLQAGLNYEELSSRNQLILSFVNPKFKDEIKESFLKKLQQDWDLIASKSTGLIPNFDKTSDDFLNELGEVGQSIKSLRAFRNDIRNGANLSDLMRRIDTQTHSQSSLVDTHWSKLSEVIYARFVTQKSFLSVGQIQVRILSRPFKRAPSSSKINKQIIDLHALVADPLNLNIQPLSVSLILWSRGMIGPAILAEPPMILVALFATILANQVIDWDSFLTLRDLVGTPTDQKVKKIIEEGNQVLNEELDKLEKPLRDLKIIDRKTKNTSSVKGQKSETREYTKEGGDEELQKDFEKIEGEAEKTADGLDKKELSNGNTVLKRPKTDKDPATLETQSPKGVSVGKGHLYIKVRYK